MPGEIKPAALATAKPKLVEKLELASANGLFVVVIEAGDEGAFLEVQWNGRSRRISLIDVVEDFPSASRS